MKRIITITLSVAVALTCAAQKTISIDSKADEVIKVWNNRTAPHSNEETKDEELNERGHFAHTSETVFYLFKADPAKATGQAVVVLPGGGYSKVCIRNEGFANAEWFKSQGITAMVVKYRLPNLGHKEVPLEDAQEALRYLRKNAKRLGIDPNKVGICGSSAGGHLAAYTSTFTPDKDKPAFAVLFYPVITGNTWFTHQNTFRYLLGEKRCSAEQEYYSLENRVTATTPPTLLLLCDDDQVVPPISSVLYYDALKHNGVNASMHIYPSGGHGWAGHKTFKYYDSCYKFIKDWLDGLNTTESDKKGK